MRCTDIIYKLGKVRPTFVIETGSTKASNATACTRTIVFILQTCKQKKVEIQPTSSAIRAKSSNFLLSFCWRKMINVACGTHHGGACRILLIIKTQTGRELN